MVLFLLQALFKDERHDCQAHKIKYNDQCNDDINFGEGKKGKENGEAGINDIQNRIVKIIADHWDVVIKDRQKLRLLFGGEFFVVFVKDIVQHLFPIELFDLVEVAFFHQGPASGASNQKKQNQKKQTEQGLYLRKMLVGKMVQYLLDEQGILNIGIYIPQNKELYCQKLLSLQRLQKKFSVWKIISWGSLVNAC